MNLTSKLTEEQDRLWKLVLAKVEEIKTEVGDYHGSSRGTALLTTEGDAVSTVFELDQADGSTHVYFITARRPNRLISDQTSVTVKRWFHNSEEYWEMQLSDRSDAVVVDGVHYRIRPERNLPPDCRGYGGRRFVIRFNEDGREVTTSNLWCQGKIPPVFRDRMPDNAVFVTTKTRKFEVRAEDGGESR